MIWVVALNSVAIVAIYVLLFAFGRWVVRVFGHLERVLILVEGNNKIDGSRTDRVIDEVKRVGVGTVRAAEVAAKAATIAQEQLASVPERVAERLGVAEHSKGDSGKLPVVGDHREGGIT